VKVEQYVLGAQQLVDATASTNDGN
jgi:hypothetical protein